MVKSPATCLWPEPAPGARLWSPDACAVSLPWARFDINFYHGAAAFLLAVIEIGHASLVIVCMPHCHWTGVKPPFGGRPEKPLFRIYHVFFLVTGTPINRLPIMAKSVLDLYELYNLVIARGGLVDVINKKLWQEIIKGLHLPSSITSAAFTLRTQ